MVKKPPTELASVIAKADERTVRYERKYFVKPSGDHLYSLALPKRAQAGDDTCKGK